VTARALAPVAVAVLTSTALASNAAPSSTTAPCAGGHVARTASYVLALSLGPPEAMYTLAQVKAERPRSGEVMLGGAMSPMHMAMGRAYHLELHVCSRSSGAVVTGAAPTIWVAEAKGMAKRLPVAEMEGVRSGRSDYHYGNNVAFAPGSRVTITVVLRGERATFHLVVPKAAHTMKP